MGVRAGLARHADHGRRVAENGEQGDEEGQATAEQQPGRRAAPQPPHAPHQPQLIAEQPARQQVQQRQPGRHRVRVRAVPQGVHHRDRQQQRQRRPQTRALGGAQRVRGERGDHRVDADEPQRLNDEDRRRAEGGRGHPGQGQQRQQRRPHGRHAEHRPAETYQPAAQPGARGGAPFGGPAQREGRGVAADQEEDAEQLEHPAGRGEGAEVGERAGVVQGSGVVQGESAHQPVPGRHREQGQRPQPVDGAVPVGGGPGLDGGDETAQISGQLHRMHRSTPGSSGRS